MLWACRCRRPAERPDALRTEADRLVEEAERQLRRAAQQAILPLPLDDDRYPPLLSAIPDPPPLLWIRGDPAHLLRPAIAIVGSRAATPHGLEMATRLARDLAAAGLVIVSGLARGIDSAAHSGTLAAGGSTIAILGCGPDRIYPAEHAELARNIQSAGVPGERIPAGCAAASASLSFAESHHQRTVARGRGRGGAGKERRADYGRRRQPSKDGRSSLSQVRYPAGGIGAAIF